MKLFVCLVKYRYYVEDDNTVYTVYAEMHEEET
jgi:hypothetical protein